MKLATLRRRIDVGGPELGIFQFDLAEPFPFKPGQYVTLGLETPAAVRPRPYSIASSPHETRTLEFYINLVDEGTLAPYLLALRPGDPVWYTGPQGRFTLERTNRKNLVMISTGTGLAPFISMIHKLKNDGRSQGPSDYRLVLMHGVKRTQDLGYRDQLENWSRQQDLRLHYLPTVSRPDTDPRFHPGEGQGRVNDLLRYLLGESPTGTVEPRPAAGVDVAAVRRVVQREPAFYLCGNPDMITDAREVLRRHSHQEVFTEEW
ncbi:MAG: hypothetical protein HYX74_11625 [Acidobacteria bacterium]|nr:hypothetical protein [Acidobacteriota bacterium]